MSSRLQTGPQRTTWLYRLTNVNRTRAQQFRFEHNAQPLHVSFYLCGSLTANYSCWSIWDNKCINLSWYIYIYIFCINQFSLCFSTLWVLIIIFLTLSLHVLFWKVIVFTLWSFSCTEGLGAHSPILCCWQWTCLLGLVFRSGSKQERDLSPITCLAPLYLLLWTSLVSTKGSSKSGSVQCQSPVGQSMYAHLWFRDLHKLAKDCMMQLSFGREGIFPFPRSGRHELCAQEEENLTASSLNFLSPQEQSQVVKRSHCSSLDCRIPDCLNLLLYH